MPPRKKASTPVELSKNTAANAKKADAWFSQAPSEEVLPVVRQAVATGSVSVQRVAIPHLFRLLPGPEAADVVRQAIERHHGHASYGGCGWGFSRDVQLAEALVASGHPDALRLLAEAPLPWPLEGVAPALLCAFLERLAELPQDLDRLEHLLSLELPVSELHAAAPAALRRLLEQAVSLAPQLRPTPLHLLAEWLGALDEPGLLSKLPRVPVSVRLEMLRSADGATRERELSQLLLEVQELGDVVQALTPVDAALAPLIRKHLEGDLQRLALLRLNDAETREKLEAVAAGPPDRLDTQRAISLLEQAGLRAAEPFF